jgi:uncharacterized membrane protein YkvA (DUF1232 family)
MQASATTRNVYPLTLPQASHDGRRRNVGIYAIDDPAIARFNAELAAIKPDARTVTADQLASLARWLQALPAEDAVATVSERMIRGERLRRMLDDREWDVPASLRSRAVRLLDYLERHDDLIPDGTPVIGHLDDALLVELAWGAFEDALGDYEDFRRYSARNRTRGTLQERILQWEAACLAEAALYQHRQDIRARGYLRNEPLRAAIRVY